MSSRGLPVLLTIGIFLVFFASPAKAFGAGNIINLSAVEGNNFRHGDIEDTLLQLFMTVAGQKKFDELSVKRVYFGNFLRDYSQALDVGGLKQLPADTLRLLVWILAFMTFGYATGEFEVTAERLGVYRPEEHIDNPKDYADNEDARKYDQRLRAPVDEGKELAIDNRNGLKVYIASDDKDCMTSSKFVRACFEKSIELGRKYGKDGNDPDFYEALRLLGTGSHTLEDFAAHSNYVELSLRELGVTEVFPHVGSETELEVNGKKIWPCITGTFGMIDFLHSVVGEVSDKLTQSAVQELDGKIAQAEGQDSSSGLKDILDKIPWGMISGGGGDKNFGGKMDEIQANSAAKQVENTSLEPKTIGGKDIAEMQKEASEAFKNIYPILEFHDQCMKAVSEAISKVPGLNALLDNLAGALQIFVFSMMAPFIKPILKEVKELLGVGSKGVLASSEKAQYIVFDDNKCSDPTHSVISKDHFTNVLNNPAGKVASTVVSFVAPIIVSCWDDESKDAKAAVDEILQVLHHPALRDNNKKGQERMFETVKKWWEGKSQDEQQELKDMLSREGVRAGKNHTGEDPNLGGGHSHAAGSSTTKYQPQKLNQQQQPQVQNEGLLSGGGIGGILGGVLGSITGSGNSNQGGNEGHSSGGGRRQDNQEESYGRSGRNNNESESESYGRQSGGYAGNTEESSYGGGRQGRQEESESYGSGGGGGGRQSGYGRDNEESSYGGNRRKDESESYSRRQEEEPSYGRRTQEEPSYGRRTEEESSYGRRNQEEPSYGRRTEEDSSYGGGGGGREERSSGYGGGREEGGYGGGREEGGYGGGGREERSSGYSGREEGGYGGGREEGGYGGDESNEGQGGGRRRGEGYGGDNEGYGGGDRY